MKQGIVLSVLLLLSAHFVQADSLLINMPIYHPYAYVEEGEPKGISIDIIKAAATLAKVDIHFEVLPWNRAFTLFERNEAHALAPSFKTPEREAKFLFSNMPLHTFEMALFKSKAM